MKRNKGAFTPNNTKCFWNEIGGDFMLSIPDIWLACQISGRIFYLKNCSDVNDDTILSPKKIGTKKNSVLFSVKAT